MIQTLETVVKLNILILLNHFDKSSLGFQRAVW